MTPHVTLYEVECPGDPDLFHEHVWAHDAQEAAQMAFDWADELRVKPRRIGVSSMLEPEAMRNGDRAKGGWVPVMNDTEMFIRRRGQVRLARDQKRQASGRKLEREDIDLVAVFFGSEDQGVVSLKRRAWLSYNWGRYHGHHTNLDTGAIVEVGVEDADFELLGKGRSETCNWDDVVPLLMHPEFPLLERIGGK